MAALEYRRYFLISRPRQDELQRWIPYASVSWLEGSQVGYHLLEDLNGVFDTEEEAIAFGFEVARTWIDKEREHIHIGKRSLSSGLPSCRS